MTQVSISRGFYDPTIKLGDIIIWEKRKWLFFYVSSTLERKGISKKIHWTNFWTNIEFCLYYPKFWVLFWQYSQYVNLPYLCTLIYIRIVFKDIIEYENCIETPFINLNDDASWFISNYLQMSIIFKIFILLWACANVYVYF